ncbi:hypothetical protein ALC53_08811 [Atta colombica]|uniref:Uncharacterized protein n=1 Tax=Atta colombica TaxID=520822 RepID=A0A195B8S9_9HYME|nr:hypothetical protein ALC53_08811 [Atta colombica]
MEEETRSWWLDGSSRRSRVGDTEALYVSPTTGAQPPYHRLSDSRELVHRIARSNSFHRETISTLPAREPRGKNDVDEAPANFVKYECNRHHDALHASLWASAFVTDLLDERSEQEFHTRSTNACRRFIAFIYMFPACIMCARVVGKRTPAVNRGNAWNHLERYHSLTIECDETPGRI